VVLQYQYLIFHHTIKYEYFIDADKQVAKLSKQFAKDLLTNDERYTKVVSLWNDVKDRVKHWKDYERSYKC